MKLRKKYRKKSSGIDPQQVKEKKIRNKRIVIFVLVIILVIIYSYFRLTAGGYNTITRFSDLFNNNTIAVIFFIGFLYTFRSTFRLNQPDVATIAKVCLMLLSAYFSFQLLVDLKVPSFLAMSGGLATVLGIQQTTSLGVQLFYTKKIDIQAKKRFWINGIVIIGILMALTIDIVTTFYNLVLQEGQDIRSQQLAEKAFQMRAVEKLSKAISDKSKADSMKAFSVNYAMQTGNWRNAQIASGNYAADTTLSKIDINKLLNLAKIDTSGDKKGRLELGFSRIVGNRYAAKVNFLFMIAFSISLTLTICIMEIKEELEGGDKQKKKVVYQPKEPSPGEGNGNGKSKPPKGEIVIAKGNEKRIFTESEQRIIDLAVEWDQKRPSKYKYVWIADQIGKTPAFISQRKKFFKEQCGIEI